MAYSVRGLDGNAQGNDVLAHFGGHELKTGSGPDDDELRQGLDDAEQGEVFGLERAEGWDVKQKRRLGQQGDGAFRK